MPMGVVVYVVIITDIDVDSKFSFTPILFSAVLLSLININIVRIMRIKGFADVMPVETILYINGEFNFMFCLIDKGDVVVIMTCKRCT